MSIKAYENAPYHDDFNTAGIESKNYLRILFKPGYSVQVRELNQLQTSLQSQIEKFGRSVYQEGPVLEGTPSFSKDLNYIDVDILSGDTTTYITAQLSALEGKILTTVDASSTAQANRPSAEVYSVKLVQTNVTGSIGNYRYRFFIRYTESGGETPDAAQTVGGVLQTTFIDNQNLAFSTTFGSTGQTISAGARFGRVAASGYAAGFTADRGIFFGRGSFIFNNDPQTIYITKPTKAKVINGRFVFKVVETEVTFATDNSLNDIASGTPNFQAPGADRYKVTLSPMFLINSSTDLDLLPSSKSLDGSNGTGDSLNTEVDTEASASTTVNYISLMTVNNDYYQPAAGPRYSSLDDQMATRTFEESGDYTVNPFKLTAREHLNDGADNGGRYLSTDSPAGDASKYVLTLEQGVSYVKGYRVENEKPMEIIGDKARTINDEFEKVNTSQALGQFIECAIAGETGLDASVQLPTLTPNEVYTFCDDDGITGIDDGDDTNMPTSAQGAVTCRIRAIEKNAGTNRYRIFIHDLQSAGTGNGVIPRGATKLIGEAAKSGDDDACILELVENGTSDPTPIFEVDSSISIIPLDFGNISNVSTAISGSTIDSQITHQVVETKTVSSTSLSLSCSAPSLFHSDAADSYIVVEESTGTPVTVSNVSGAGTTSVTLTLGSNPGGNCTIISSQTIGLGTGGLTKSSKSLATVTTAELLDVRVQNGSTAAATSLTASSAHSVGHILELDNYDVYEITEVQNGAGTVLANTAAEVLNFVELDDGQRDGMYIKSRVVLKSAQTGLKVKYKYLSHDDSGDYFSVDSYPSSFYASIPEYKSFPLADVLDFRKKDTATSGVALDPNAAASIKVKYYQGRMDKLIVTADGDYEIVTGTPALNPGLPPLPKDSMALYDIIVPAYTKKVENITLSLIDNRRFTMRDIGNLEKRIKNLEYYTSLSLLEREATGKQILNADSSERFKNGILVDSFLTQGIGDAQDPGFAVAYDLDEGELRSTFTTKNTRLVLPSGTPTNGAKNTSNANVAATQWNYSNYTLGSNPSTTVTSTDGLGDYLIMPFTEEVLIKQDQASMSMSVNPYDMATWNGQVELSPSSDEWKETARRPDVVMNINSGSDAVASLLNGSKAFSTVWNEWERHGKGKVISRSSKRLSQFSGRRGSNWRRRPQRSNFRGRFGSRGRGIALNAEWAAARQQLGPDRRPIRKVTTTIQTTEIREGIRREASVNTVTQRLGDRVVDISFIPFMRSRKVYFKAQLMKPKTKLYAFFDDINVSFYCSKGTFVEFKNSSEVGTSSLGGTHYTTSSGLSGRQELVTDSSGNLEGYFIVPGNNKLRFRTGVRKFKLTDSSTNNLAETTTSATTEYSATGVLQTVEGQIVSTRQLSIDEDRISQKRKGIRKETKTEYYDPLAQSFLIGNIPTGCFATSIDLFFSARSSNVPLSVHLVTVENGIPTQKIVPKSKVIKQPNEVYIDSRARDATKFDFKDPIYLKAGVEYAIVVMSNSPDYRLWMSETGGIDATTGTAITKNTYAGVSFKSQNASTWTPDQNKDFKFTIRRAKFKDAAGNSGATGAPVTQGYKLHPLGLSDTEGNRLTFSLLNFTAEEIVIPGTQLDYVLGIGDEDYDVIMNSNLYFEELHTISSAGNSGTGTGHLDVTFSSESEFISPVIDLERFSIIGVDNVIASKSTSIGVSGEFGDTGDTELAATHGGATARYITREVELNDAASQVNVFFGANRPSANTDIGVYIRTKVEGRIQDQTFTRLAPDSPINIDSNGGFGDSEFVYEQNELFSSFQVKVIFTSSSTAETPIITDFRAVATT